MSEKRRDSKNRILQSGESQRPDGRYQYKCTDAFGEPKFVYSWKLVPTDKIPAGKRADLSLREKIKQIQKDLDDGIDTIGKKMTVCQLYAKYIRQRGNVKLSDAKEWALRMQEKELPDFIQEDKVYQKYYDEIVILLETGLRVSELCGPTDTDLDFEKGYVKADHQLLRSAEDGFYIETPLPKVMTPHTMRHTFCTKKANAGMNPKALQYIMGHANIVMTLNYYATLISIRPRQKWIAWTLE